MKLSKFIAPFMVLLTLVAPGMALAQTDTTPSSPENVFSSEEKVGGISIAGDLFWTGTTFSGEGAEVGRNLFAAGQDMTLKDITIGDDAYVAGVNIALSGTTSVGGSVFSAGSEFYTAPGSSAGALYVTATTVKVDGSVGEANISAGTVDIEGTIEGDANITAQSVTIGQDAVINGTLNITADEKPSIPSTASVADINYVNTTDAANGSGVTPGFNLTSWLMSLAILFIMSYPIAALFLGWTPYAVRGAEISFSRSAAKLLLSGFSIMVVAPFLIFFLLLSLLGTFIGLVGILAYVAVLLCSIGFTSAALAGKYLKGSNRWTSTLLMTVMISALVSLPYIGTIIFFLTASFTFGYMYQRFMLTSANRNFKARQLTQASQEAASGEQTNENSEQ